jgi:hypothetical protein
VETSPVLDLEKDEYTLTDLYVGALVFCNGQPHQIMTLRPSKTAHNGIACYDADGWGVSVMALDCELCGKVRAFAGLKAMDNGGWLRLWVRPRERFFCGLRCTIAYLQHLEIVSSDQSSG